MMRLRCWGEKRERPDRRRGGCAACTMMVSRVTKSMAVYCCVGSCSVRMLPVRFVMSPKSQMDRKTCVERQ